MRIPRLRSRGGASLFWLGGRHETLGYSINHTRGLDFRAPGLKLLGGNRRGIRSIFTILRGLCRQSFLLSRILVSLLLSRARACLRFGGLGLRVLDGAVIVGQLALLRLIGV